MEEIVYDLSIRGLVPDKSQNSSSDKKTSTSSQTSKDTNDSSAASCEKSSEVTNVDSESQHLKSEGWKTE